MSADKKQREAEPATAEVMVPRDPGLPEAVEIFDTNGRLIRRLVEANLRKQEAPVIEVERLVRELRDAWAQMLSGQDNSASIERIRGVA